MFTHNTRAHTHTLYCPSTVVVVVVVVVSSVVCSRPLSLSFLVRKKKGEEKRKTTEDHPKTVESNAAVQIQKREIKISNVLIFLQEDVKEDSLRESKRGYTHPRIPLFSLCDRLERL